MTAHKKTLASPAVRHCKGTCSLPPQLPTVSLLSSFQSCAHPDIWIHIFFVSKRLILWFWIHCPKPAPNPDSTAEKREHTSCTEIGQFGNDHPLSNAVLKMITFPNKWSFRNCLTARATWSYTFYAPSSGNVYSLHHWTVSGVTVSFIGCGLSARSTVSCSDFPVLTAL